MKEKNKNPSQPSLIREGVSFPLTRGIKGVPAFTLVELIIVITILAILATIAFTSFQNYSKSARDGNRTATLKNIEKGLNLVEIKSSKYPKPDDFITISSGTTIYINQGIVGQIVSSEIKLNKESKDPKDNTNYLYSTNGNNTKYQLGTYLEEDNKVLLSYFNLPQTYASSIDYTNRYFYTIGDKVGIFLRGATNKPLLKTESLTGVDLATNTTDYKIYFSNDVNSGSITGSGSDLVDEIIENQESSGTQQETPVIVENCNGKSIGQACAGGIYAGSSGQITYIATPSGCTDSSTPTCNGGTDSLSKPWNYGNANWTTTSMTSTTDGLGNTTALATTIDADSSTAGIQPHLAAKYCYDMVYGGYSDWFLPAKDELNLLYTNRVTIGGFVTNGYWSSPEDSYSTAWYQHFANGSPSLSNKNNSTYYVRCIRKF